MGSKKVWIDSLTPKQIFFYKPVYDFCIKNDIDVRWTSRSYTETSPLIEQLDLPITEVGYWAETKHDKLLESIRRIRSLLPAIDKFKPDYCISSLSPEMSRIAFGLGLKYIGYTDTPHSYYVMKMGCPYVTKLLTPWIFPKSDYTKHGVNARDIIKYRALDPYLTNQRTPLKPKQPGVLSTRKNGKQIIIIRPEETHASYHTTSSAKMIHDIVRVYGDKCFIVILCRYRDQYDYYKQKYGLKAKVTMMKYDGRYVLEFADLFIGSGGTMTVESALLGVPTISMNTAPNDQEILLVRDGLVLRADESQMTGAVYEYLKKDRLTLNAYANAYQATWENPHNYLFKLLKE
jgi:predicted glycosyltransferase